jgi:hypothetical protein
MSQTNHENSLAADEFPVLTEVIDTGLNELDKATARTPEDWRLAMLSAQLPDLFEKAILRVKPQLIKEFESLLREAMTHSENKSPASE